ncbi:uncharacterized protein BP01DRAFT_60041 [Aspergillus saccharolyticus JOP 1030-1]|uniref:Uncharacterized protein n=1 Tax=Aspergillus saccharolyticus JOP 1030-1 TaxID=1450539 RepID=A0A318ZK02_9EURO|nr:hypothetical protein BP01DRAFT_60041 [Aspergillus saccharolyticus JOP 1030-1]PYH44883.1 hypothetical protein BP01DRAFT_60041 [Aspergillus saccharolyticus JOP 1030-1]
MLDSVRLSSPLRPLITKVSDVLLLTVSWCRSLASKFLRLRDLHATFFLSLLKPQKRSPQLLKQFLVSPCPCNGPVPRLWEGSYSSAE